MLSLNIDGKNKGNPLIIRVHIYACLSIHRKQHTQTQAYARPRREEWGILGKTLQSRWQESSYRIHHK